MASWNDVVAAAPDLAQRAQAIFDAHRHKTIATLRKDGSPRISGIEADFRDGEVYVGSMPNARKAQDLLRDGRYALHSASVDPEDETGRGWPGDAKIAGVAVEVTDPAIKDPIAEKAPPGPFHLFRLDVHELVVAGLGGDPPDHMVIELWTPERGQQRFERK